MADLEGVIDVLHRRGLVTIGVGDDEARVLLAHPGGQGAHGGGGHGLVALGEFLAGEGAQGGRVEDELGHRRPDRGAATGAGEVLPHQLPGRWRQGAALQALDDMGGIEGIGRIEVMGLGAQGMHAGALELLEDEGGELAGHRAGGGPLHAAQHRLGEGQALAVGEAGGIHVGRLLAAVVEVLGVHQHHLLKAMAPPVGDHRLVGQAGDHGMVLLTVAVPDQGRQEVGHLGIGGVEVHHGVEHVGLAHAAVADGHREELVRVEQGASHGEVLALTQGARGGEQAGDGAGEVAEQAVLLAEAGHHVVQGADAHLLQGGVEEHGAVEARRVVAHLGDDVGVAQHHQGGVGLGAGGEAAGVAGAL